MTIAVGAVYNGGAVVGADRMLEIGGNGRKNADCNFRKLFYFSHKSQAVAVAGDIQLSYVIKPPGEEIVCDYAKLVQGAFEFNKASGTKLASDSLEAYAELGRLLQYERFDAEVLVVEPIENGFGLWSRSYRVRNGYWQEPIEIDFGQNVLGIGCYKTYSTFLTDPGRIMPDARRTLSSLTAPPKLPQSMFPNRDTAESWVREVIDWCCVAFPDMCGGSPDVFHLT